MGIPAWPFFLEAVCMSRILGKCVCCFSGERQAHAELWMGVRRS